MTAIEFLETVASVYRDKPDSYTVSIGHWKHWPGEPLPSFYADIATSAGQLRAMVAALMPPSPSPP